MDETLVITARKQRAKPSAAHLQRAKGSPEQIAATAKRIVTRKKNADAVQAARSAETTKANERTTEGWTAKKRMSFLLELAEGGSAKAAGRAIGLHAQGAYAIRRRDPGFAALWSQALDQYAEAAEARATEIALNGIDREVVHLGEVRKLRSHSAGLITTMLTRRRPGSGALPGGVVAVAAVASPPAQAGADARIKFEAAMLAIARKLDDAK